MRAADDSHGPDARRSTPADDAREWDERYGGDPAAAPMWSGQPNGSLVVEAGDLTPGTALEVGCGEGADAIWLAQQGWQVTALDPSRVALDRASAAARAAEVDVTWVCAGLLEAAGDLGRFDLVSAQYLAIRRDAAPAGHAVVDALLSLVAPGGTLLFVHHDLDPHLAAAHAAAHGAGRTCAGHGHAADRSLGGHAPSGDVDLAAFVMPRDVADRLDDGWTVEVDEIRPRPGRLSDHARHVRDVVLRARRSGGLVADRGVADDQPGHRGQHQPAPGRHRGRAQG